MIRRNWENVPDAVFIGADPLHPKTAAHLAARLEYPDEITPALRAVLGMMMHQTVPIAHVFREAGHEIPCKVENEHAFVLHRLIKLVLKLDDAWQPEFGRELQAAVDKVKTQRAENTQG